MGCKRSIVLEMEVRFSFYLSIQFLTILNNTEKENLSYMSEEKYPEITF